MAKLPAEQVQTMLAQLREHFGQPVMPVGAYCEAFRSWQRAVEEAVERKPTDRSLTGTLQRIREVSLDVLKSNLLYRLLYLGEPLRTEPCPIHKGHWSGCASPEQDCPHCMSGNNVTGWVKLAPPRESSMAENFKQVYGLSTFVFRGTTLLDSPSMGGPEERPFIYTVSSLDVQGGGHPKSRCWGWFETLEQAEEYLFKDYGDIHEGGTNKWAVIEKCESGVCPSAYKHEDRWYRFIRMESQNFKWTAERIECPEELNGIIGWGLG